MFLSQRSRLNATVPQEVASNGSGEQTRTRSRGSSNTKAQNSMLAYPEAVCAFILKADFQNFGHCVLSLICNRALAEKDSPASHLGSLRRIIKISEPAHPARPTEIKVSSSAMQRAGVWACRFHRLHRATRIPRWIRQSLRYEISRWH